METITFIGNGNMAFAIADRLKDNFNIEVVARDQQKLDNFEKKFGKNIKKSLLDNFDISNKNIIFCVKPANLQEVGKKLSGVANEFYSVLAGTTLEDLKQNIKSIAYIRAMPNLAASVKKSITTLVGDEVLKQRAIILFNSIGSNFLSFTSTFILLSLLFKLFFLINTLLYQE